MGFFNTVKSIIKINKSKINSVYSFFYDFKRHLKFSLNYKRNTFIKDSLRCSIMLLNHQLEKAQTYSAQKEKYGHEKLCLLLNIVEIYVKKYGTDNLIFTSFGVLKSHFENGFSWKDEKSKSRFKKLALGLTEEPFCGGINNVTIGKYDVGAFRYLLSSRRSCRSYASTPVPNEIIKDAVTMAMMSPSACNRQPVRCHIYSDKEQIRKIVIAQKADIEWCLSADKLIIVSVNEFYYRDSLERNQRMFDAGLFSMTLNLSFHAMGVGSCFKMAQKHPLIDKKTKEIAGIQDSEDICVLLLIGMYPKNGFVAASLPDFQLMTF